MQPDAWLVLLLIAVVAAYAWVIAGARTTRGPKRAPQPDFELAEELNPAVLRPRPESAEPWLPLTYGEDVLELLVRDPYWMFAFWELVDSQWQRRLGRTWSEGQLVLRLEDATAGTTVLETAVDPVGSWYLFGEKPGHMFIARLGRRLADGTFIELLRSQAVTTPPTAPSAVFDPEWMPQVHGQPGPDHISSPALVRRDRM
jgi:hypothetical protein